MDCTAVTLLISVATYARSGGIFFITVLLQIYQRILQYFDAVGWVAGRSSGLKKNWVVRCWHGYLSGTRCRLAYGPADATATHCLLLQ